MKTRKTTPILLALLSGTVMMSPLVASRAYAEAAAANAADNSVTNLSEVVVTATKRETSAQKTPVAITVYSGAALEASGVHSLEGLTTIDPSVNLTKSTGAAYVAVRGVASTDVTEIGDPSVPIARDGFFVNRSFSIATSMYDLERVEVLKGPQGTVFGRNSTGGLISIVTAKPKDTLGGDINLTVGDYNQQTAEGAINIPVGDMIQVRAAGITSRHDGYRTETGINRSGDDEDVNSGRLSVAFEPFAHFKGLVSAQIDKIGGAGDVVDDQPLQSGKGTPVSFTTSQSKTFAAYQPSSENIRSDRYRWEFTYDALPFGTTLYYGGGFDRSAWDHSLDSSSSATNLSQFVQKERPDTWNHEIRLSSPDSNRWTWQVGYFDFSEENNLVSELHQTGGQFTGLNLIQFTYNVKTTSEAFFGTTSYKLTDNLKVTMGARETNDVKTRTGNAVLDLTVASGGFLALPYNACYFGPPPPGGCSHLIQTTPGNGHIDQSKPTYHFGVDWNWAPANLLYVKYDTGYKSGGFNSNGSAPSVPYNPETMEATEIGSKNRFLDNHLQLNADVFHQDYSGYQASQVTAALGGAPGIQNAGSATIDGLEVQATYVNDLLGRFDLNSTYLHTKFASFTALDGAGNPVAIGGNKLPNAPELSTNIAWERDFKAFGGTLTPRADVKISSSYFFSFFNTLDTRQDAYTTGNLSLTYAAPGSKWSVQGFVHNITDEVVLANAARNYNSNLNTYQFAPPRTFGVRLSADF